MKIYFDAHLTLHMGDHRWAVIFTPAIFLHRRDIFCDEKAYYFVIQWLIFSVQMIVTKKKKPIPEGECNISIDEILNEL